MYLNNYQQLKNKKAFLIILLISISIVVRIPIIFIFGDIQLDNEWKILVDNLIIHGTLSFRNFDGILIPNLYMPPLYSFYLYLFSIITSEQQYFINLVLFSQALLASLSVVLFYKINKFFFSEKISFYSSLLFSLFPLHVYACSQISSITLQIFLILFFFYLFFKIENKKKIITLFVFSIVSGFSMLLRGEFAIIFFISLIFLYFFLKISLRNILLILLISLITISPYLARNFIIFKEITITKTLGYNLWKGNNPNSKVEGSEIINENLREQIKKIEKNKYYQINHDKIFLDQAVKNIIDDPKRYIALFFKKFFSFWFVDLHSTQDNYYNPLHYLPVLFLGVSSIFGIFVYDKKSLKTNYLILIYFAYIFIFSCFFILPRYKLIIIPLQILFSNFLIVHFYNKFFYGKKNKI
tara:strand:+ start:1863 stop:3098 length:1236 start_codon:yes stop_codon:yes gene_type:complete